MKIFLCFNSNSYVSCARGTNLLAFVFLAITWLLLLCHFWKIIGGVLFIQACNVLILTIIKSLDCYILLPSNMKSSFTSSDSENLTFIIGKTTLLENFINVFIKLTNDTNLWALNFFGKLARLS